MKKFLLEKNVRIRCKKRYPEAHNHVLIGKVVEENECYLAIKGRSFHFSGVSTQLRSQIFSGDVMVRIVPWENIEIIHWISEKTDWHADISFDSDGNLILQDKPSTVIAMRRDGRD